MFGFVSRRFFALVSPSRSCRHVSEYVDTTTSDLGLRLTSGFYLHNARSLPFRVESFTTEIAGLSEKHRKDSSFTVSYLINSCGFSPEMAQSISEKLKLKSAKQPDSVLEVLKNNGFTITHIAKLVRVRPTMLLADAAKTILPKFEFFKSIGVTDADLASVCCTNPCILAQSMEKRLIPSYKFLKTVLVSDEAIVNAFRKKSWLFNQDAQKILSPKFAHLKELGVPETFFPLIIRCYSRAILPGNDKFEQNVKKAIQMGFSPQRWTFIQALHVFGSISQETWEYKLDIFKKWGWSNADCSSAFLRYPTYTSISENNIESKFDFLVNKMGWQSTDLVKYPNILLLNLERRIIPRCLVIKVLQSKGLCKTNSIRLILSPNEKNFLDEFVRKHIDAVPQLLNICKGGKTLKLRRLEYDSDVVKSILSL